ncbi:MAG: hypothetical protein ACUVXI_02280 [bacterium]
MYDIGTRVKVTKSYIIARQRKSFEVVGRIVEKRRVRTESSFARGKRDRLWIDEIVLEKDDGERSAIVIDRTTKIEKIS